MLSSLSERMKRKKHHLNSTKQNIITMSKQQEFDLIKQTQKNLQDKKGEYTVDFLFDCMKIFFIHQSKWLKKLPTSIIDKENWGIAPRNIKVCKAYHKDGIDISTVKDDYSVRNVARHIHNSVIHYFRGTTGNGVTTPKKNNKLLTIYLFKMGIINYTKAEK